MGRDIEGCQVAWGTWWTVVDSAASKLRASRLLFRCVCFPHDKEALGLDTLQLAPPSPAAEVDSRLLSPEFAPSGLPCSSISVEVGIQLSWKLFVVDAVNSNIVRITPPLSQYSRARLIAGSFQGYTGHVDGKPNDARFDHPKGVTMDDKGNVYVADTSNLAIRKIGESGVTTIAGGKSSVAGYRDGPSEDAQFSTDFDVIYMRPRAILSAEPTFISLGSYEQAHVFSSKTGGCATFLANYHLNSSSTVRFRNTRYNLPPWSISILPDCRHVAFNTTQVGSRTSVVNMLPAHVNRLSWQAFSADISSVDSGSKMIVSGLLDQLSVTRDATDYLWYSTRYRKKHHPLPPPLRYRLTDLLLRLDDTTQEKGKVTKNHLVHERVNNLQLVLKILLRWIHFNNKCNSTGSHNKYNSTNFPNFKYNYFNNFPANATTIYSANETTICHREPHQMEDTFAEEE